jgi:hypothetical protein
MEARRLIEGAAYGPDELKAICQAFDEAWARLAPRCGDDQAAIKAGRMKLANIVLSLARAGSVDAAGLRDTALEHYKTITGER